MSKILPHYVLGQHTLLVQKPTSALQMVLCFCAYVSIGETNIVNLTNHKIFKYSDNAVPVAQICINELCMNNENKIKTNYTYSQKK